MATYFRFFSFLFFFFSLPPSPTTRGGEKDLSHIGFYVARTDGSGYRVVSITPEDLVTKVWSWEEDFFFVSLSRSQSFFC